MRKIVMLSLVVIFNINIAYAVENYGALNYNSGIYGLEECGNGLCESSETCSTCSSDCGTCPSGPAPSAGGGGGGGGGAIAGQSSYNWQCTDWSQCTPAGIQSRTCTNLGSSPDGFGKPAETRECSYVQPEVTPTVPVVPSKGKVIGVPGQVQRISKPRAGEAKKAPEVESITGRIVRFTGRFATGPQLFVGALAISAIGLIIIIFRIELKGFFRR